jgi:hypothetical protein
VGCLCKQPHISQRIHCSQWGCSRTRSAVGQSHQYQLPAVWQGWNIKIDNSLILELYSVAVSL